MKKFPGLESILALGIAAGGVAYSGCGDDDVTSDDGGDVPAETDADVASDDAYTNHAPDPIDVSSITPANGTAYNVGDRIPFSFDVPNDEDGDELTGVIHVTGDSDTTPGPSAGDYSKDIPISGPLTSGSHVSQDINTATAGPGGAELPTRADGSATPYTLEIILEDGRGGEARAERNVTITKPVRVTGCYVDGSSVGAGLAISCHGESSAGSITGWNLTGGPTGAIVLTDGTIARAGMLGVGDVGLHTYTVSCTDGTNTSDEYIFTVPVDEHASVLRLHCSGGSDNDLLLPETSVDAVASACGTGFNPDLKPAVEGGAHYILDVTPSCVQGAIDSLIAEEREAHTHYNNGTTVSDVYSGCTVDFAQVEYIHN
jgi:hypothetical protein